MNKLSSIVQLQLKHNAPYAWLLRNQANTRPFFRGAHLAELGNRLESYPAYLQGGHPETRLLLEKLNPDDWGICLYFSPDGDCVAYKQPGWF